jgi:hypothetical protein
MTHDDPETSVSAVVEDAEAAFGLELHAGEMLRNGRATVIRASSLRGPVQGPVVIKQFKEEYREHFVRESVGLGLLSSIPDLARFVPRLLADDDAGRMLLIEAIDERQPYGDTIFSDELAATEVLVETARRLGLLHGCARSKVPAFRAKVPECSSPGLLLRKAVDPILGFIRRALNDNAGVSAYAIGSDLQSELMRVADEVDEPGHLSTITVGDMAPSNVLLGPDGPVFVDFEYCGIRSGFYDAMYWHCICPFSSDIANRMDIAYRGGLDEGGLHIVEDQFMAKMFLFMSHRLFWSLSWNMEVLFERDRDVVPGTSTRRIICEYLREYSRFAAILPRPEHAVLISIARTLEARLSQLWPEVGAGH